jgi:hypothetical protein
VTRFGHVAADDQQAVGVHAVDEAREGLLDRVSVP